MSSMYRILSYKRLDFQAITHHTASHVYDWQSGPAPIMSDQGAKDGSRRRRVGPASTIFIDFEALDVAGPCRDHVRVGRRPTWPKPGLSDSCLDAMQGPKEETSLSLYYRSH